MLLEEAFSLVQDIEAQYLASNHKWSSINYWPLMRQCFWLELTQATESVGAQHTTNSIDTIHRRIFNRVISEARAFCNRPSSIGSEVTAFISRPVYLQALPNGNLFDRIMDPLIFCMPADTPSAKYYVAPLTRGDKLNYPAALLRPFNSFTSRVSETPEMHRTLLISLAGAMGIDSKRLLRRYEKNLKAFDKWLHTARHFFDSRKNLKTIYLTSWYFPDMMGLITAARERGIQTIEVQHGKQGRFQAMYSGWRIPEEGYQILPDVFWSWGEPSAEHILTTSPNRRIHRPIVGGFPWLDYYRQHISRKTLLDRKEYGKSVLITIQPPQGNNNQPIPDFLLDFLRENPRGVFFIFRCHPNYHQGPAYCRERLSELPSEIYKIDDGYSNLYDSFIGVTHHITAYSSCCYEARAFGVPTLLYGADAKTIYKDEIDNELFSWTPGRINDLALWLNNGNIDKCLNSSEYILSSLHRAASILQDAELGNFDFYVMNQHRMTL